MSKSDPELVCATLESLDLGQYSHAFLNAGYDSMEKASRLTEELLEYKLGISLSGHRRRILSAMRQSPSQEDTIRGEEEYEDAEEAEIYDLPPTPRSIPRPASSRIVHDIPDYLNFKELNIIPTPMLPPKQKKYPDDDLLKFGIGQSIDVSSNSSSVSVISGAVKRPPIPKPRQSIVLDDKPALPPPRIATNRKSSSAVKSVPSPAPSNSSNSEVIQDTRFCNDLISFDPVTKFTNWTMYGNTADDVGSNYDILTQRSSPVEVYDKLPHEAADPSKAPRPPVPIARKAPSLPVRAVQKSPACVSASSVNSSTNAAGLPYKDHSCEGLASEAGFSDDIIYEDDSPLQITRPAPPPPRGAQLKNTTVEVPQMDSYELLDCQNTSTKSNNTPPVVARAGPLGKGLLPAIKKSFSKPSQPIQVKREISRPGIPPPPNACLSKEDGQNQGGEILYEDCEVQDANEYIEPTNWTPEKVRTFSAGPVPPQRHARQRINDKVDDGTSSESGSDGYSSRRSTLQGSSSSETLHDRDDVSISSQKSSSKNVRLTHAGFLSIIVNSASVNSVKMWCILEGKSFYCLESDKTTSRRETIDMKETLSISVINDARHANSFQMIHRSPDKSLSFCAESQTDMKLWILKFARSMADVDEEDRDLITELDRGGHVIVKLSVDMENYRTWAHLYSKTLCVYTKDEEFEEIDLRKSKSIKFQDAPIDGRTPELAFVLQLTNNRVIQIRGETKKETESWFSAIRRFMLDVDGSLSNQVLTTENVPLLVDKCITFVSSYAMRTVGIYRLTGQNSKITKLLDLLRADARDVILRTEEYQVHEVATTLKRFLRCLDEPLMTQNLYSKWIETAKMNVMTSKLHRYKCLLDQLSLVNYCTLKRIIIHLARVADLEQVNKMSAENLASIFGPILLSGIKTAGALSPADNSPQQGASVPQQTSTNQEQGFTAVKEEIIVIKDIILNNKQLFEVKDAELEQEKRIQEAVEKIEALNNQDKHASLSTMLHECFMIGVYIGNRGGEVVNVKIPLSMSAHELQNHILNQVSVEMTGLWTLFEVICDGQLERPIHCSECVFDVALTWNTWPVEFCRSNYICYKQNTLYETLQVLYQPGMSLCAELQFSRNKKFRKQYMELNNNQLAFRKDIKASSPSTVWNVSSLIIYLGVQRDRFPPTAWGISFYFGGGNPLSFGSSCFGFSLCCKNEEEMSTWLSALLHGQNPEGLLPREGASVTARSKTLNRLNSEPLLPQQPLSVRPRLITNIREIRERLLQIKHDTLSKISSS